MGSFVPGETPGRKGRAVKGALLASSSWLSEKPAVDRLACRMSPPKSTSSSSSSSSSSSRKQAFCWCQCQARSCSSRHSYEQLDARLVCMFLLNAAL
eukprot:683004-Pelagomonas_calceolata.AAC.1